MRHKTWPQKPFGPENLARLDSMPLEKQPKARHVYIWNIPPEEWPAGITAEEVTEMKRRHDKGVTGKAEKEGKQIMAKRCCASCRWYKYEAGTRYNWDSERWMDFTEEEDCCPKLQTDFMTGEED